MVDLSVLRLTKRKTTALLLVIIILINLSGCGGWGQPSSSEMVAANGNIKDEPFAMQVFLSFVNEEVIFAYSSEVAFQGKISVWTGTARTLYKLTTFEQQCSTVTTEAGSQKLWRGKHARSETGSPSDPIAHWLAMAAAGQGRAVCELVRASDISSFFPQETGLVHLLILDDVAVDWRSLCDANIDTLFGGEDLLSTAGTCTVTLMFRQNTFELVGAYLSAMEGETALEGALLLTPAESGPVIDGLLFSEEPVIAPLAEEWEMIGR